MRIRFVVISLIGLLTAFVLAAFAAAKEPAAMITNISGEVYLLREGAVKKGRAELASFLFAGDKLDLGGNGVATLVYFGGCRQEVLKGRGAVLVGEDKTKDLGKAVVSSTPLKKCGPPPKVEITTESSLAKGVLTLRGQAMITRLSPSETKVADLHPTFSWLTARSVLPQQFNITVYDKGLNKLWESRVEMTKGGPVEIRYPASAPPLKPGEMYRWSVNNDAYAYFAVGTEEEIKALEERKKGYEQSGQSSSGPAVNLLSALMYEEAGFILEAANYYQKVLQLAPQSSQVRLRLARLYDQMGWQAEAKLEIEEAKKLGAGK